MHTTNLQPSPLLVDWLPHIKSRLPHAHCLDLACGNGRNGAYLLDQGYSVCFADRQQSCLDSLDHLLDALKEPANKEKATRWLVDFEKPGSYPLRDLPLLGNSSPGKSFDVIIVFNYLHRALMDDIKAAITKGGYVVYETFTVEQPRFGRPTNPNFLLQEKELETLFSDWHIDYYFEGIKDNRAFASLIARKP